MAPSIFDYLTDTYAFRIPLAKRQLQWLFLIRVITLTLLLGISILLQSRGLTLAIPPHKHIAIFTGGVYLFTILSAILLNRISRFKRFAYIQLLFDSIIASSLVFFTNGSQSIFSILYFIPIVTASIMLFRTGSFFLAAVTTLEYGTILVLEILPYRPPIFEPYWPSPVLNSLVMMHHFAVYGLSFFLVAGLSSILSERLQRTEEVLTRTTMNYDRLLFLYKQIFDDIDTGIITVSTQGRITSFNRAAETITGYGAFETIDRFIAKLFPGLVTDVQTSPKNFASLKNKDNSTIPVGFSKTRLNMPEGCDDCWVYTIQDLSRIQDMEKKMQQAEKMATIGQMAAGIAHEFRNPIAAISGAAQVLEGEFPHGSPNQGLITIILRESNRLEETISDFLLFSRPAKPEKKWRSLADLLDEAIFLLKQSRDWHGDCEIHTDISSHIDCYADQYQLVQILLNLTQNGVNAMHEQQTGGTVTIHAEEIGDDNGHPQIAITVSDSGPGIPPIILENIFEPFFTTRENGTGLGLAIVKQIVASHDGTVEVFSEAGKGARFTVRLPLP